MRTTIQAIALCGVLLLCASARADNSVSLRLSSSFIKDSSFDVVSENDHLAQVEISYARRMLELFDGELWVEGSYLAGPTGTTIFGGAAETDALLQTVTVGARFGYPVFFWLVPYVRLGMGVGIGTLTLTAAEQDSVYDRAACFAGHVLAGVEVLWPRRALRTGASAFTFGLLIEAGYAFASRLEFELAPEGDEDLQQIPLRGSGMGGLSTSGAQLRVGAVVRF
jgi:hypothetical protein